MSLIDRIRRRARFCVDGLGYKLSRLQEHEILFPRAVSYPDAQNFDISDAQIQAVFDFVEQNSLFHVGAKDHLQIRGAWGEYLKIHRKDQIAALSARDYQAYRKLMLNMFRNTIVDGLGYNNFDDPLGLNPDVFEGVAHFRLVTGRAMIDISSDLFGNAWGIECGVAGRVVRPTSAWHGLQADALLKLLQTSTSSNRIVVELGSGFGGVPEFVIRWGRRGGEGLTYILCDIPLNLTSAYIYLSHHFGIDRCRFVNHSDDLIGVDVKQAGNGQIEFIFLPATKFELVRNLRVDVFLNCGSLSEMGEESIRHYLSIMPNPQTAYMLDINSNWESSNSCGHMEIPAKRFPMPNTHGLLSRSLFYPNSRYTQAIWKNLSS